MSDLEDHNPEDHDVEVLPVGTKPPSVRDGQGGGVQQGKQNIIIGTLNVFADPARGAFVEPIERRYWRHYHPDRPHASRHLVVDVVLFVALAGLIAFNSALYIGFGRSYLPGVQLTLTHEGSLVSGSRVQYTIQYTNDNEGRLHDARLALRLPPALIDVNVTPATGFNRNTNTWTLGAIDPGGDATLTVRGRLLGGVGDTATIGATLSYRPEGGRRSEQKLVLDQALIERSTLVIRTEGPTSHINGQPVTLRVVYVNEGDEATPPLLVTPTFPEGFVLTRSTPPLTRGALHVDRLPSGGEGVLVIEGTLDGRAASAVDVPFAVAFVHDGRTLSQVGVVHTIPLFYPRFGTTLSINTPSLRPGVVTTYRLTYKNEETIDALDAQIAVQFPDGLIDHATVVSDSGVLDHEVIRFTKARVPALALVKPGGEGILTFTVATREDIDARILFPGKSPLVTIPVTTTYRLEPNVLIVIPVVRPVELKMSAGLLLQSIARYFTPDGDQLGRGALPPQVGKTTRYWIFWNVHNAVSDVRAVVARGVLPASVAWTGKMSVTYGDPLKFDPVTRRVTWNLDVVKRETGGIYPDVGAFFEVAVTPDATAAGTYASLVTEQRIEGQDSVTLERIARETPDVTTELPHDERARGGKVRP